MNHRSRTTAFWALPALLFAFASVAKADRVVVLPPAGTDAVEELDRIEEQLSEAVRALSHEALTEAGAHETRGETPETANELRAIAEIQQAEWAIVAIVHDHGERNYYLTLRVGYAPSTRVEELDAEVRLSRERDRLVELLQAMLRPEGLSEDGLALAGRDQVAREAEGIAERDAAEQARLDAERHAEEERERAEREAAEAAEREAQEAAEREAREREEREAFENRDRYGVADGNMMLQVGGGVRGLVVTPNRGNGGAIATLALRLGRGFESVPGLELRAGIEVAFASASALSVFGGAVYLASPFAFPLHLGASIEVGYFQSISGNRSPAFMGRASAVAAYNPAGSFYVELSAGELQYLTTGGGAFALGFDLRLGTRF